MHTRLAQEKKVSVFLIKIRRFRRAPAVKQHSRRPGIEELDLWGFSAAEGPGFQIRERQRTKIGVLLRETIGRIRRVRRRASRETAFEATGN
jgi:hypothetical protein